MPKLAISSVRNASVIFIDVNHTKKMKGVEWSRRMGGDGTNVGTKAKKVLRSTEEPMGVTAGKTLAIIRPDYLKDEDRTIRNIYRDIRVLGFRQTNPGAICLLEENLSDEELHDMGFWWLVGLHKPLVFNEKPYLLSFGRSDLHRSFNVCRYKPDHKWKAHNGFVCEVA